MKTLASLLLMSMLVLGVYATRDSLRPRLARQAVSGVHIRDARSQVIAASADLLELDLLLLSNISIWDLRSRCSGVTAVSMTGIIRSPDDFPTSFAW